MKPEEKSFLWFTCYSNWVEEHKSILLGFKRKTLFLLFSGGKDSSLALDFLLKASGEYGFRVETHAGIFPLHRYDEEAMHRIGAYWLSRGVQVNWHSLTNTDEVIDHAENPCLPCQRLRRNALRNTLNQWVRDWNRLVIVVNYNLWDLASYVAEHLLADVFSGDGHHALARKNERFMEVAQRFYPITRMSEGYEIFRPLIKQNEDDIKTLVDGMGIPTVAAPCKYAGLRPKRILEKYFRSMGVNFNYDQVFRFAKTSLNLPELSYFISLAKEEIFLKYF
jgi:tRNA(Ile)-lysidine synthase TilS/MesJ